MLHIGLGEQADLLMIAPASANTLAKLAHGIADNLLTRHRAGGALPAAGRPGDGRRHVRAPGHPGQPGILRSAV